jgi:hypothetical protein
MSSPRFANIAHQLHEALAETLWIQWRTLGGQVAAPRAPGAIVDPEALVLASLCLADDEPRLWDMLFGFAGVGSRLLSVQRVKRALGTFPIQAEERLPRFASWVTTAAKDPRWRSLAGKPAEPWRAGKVAPPAARMGEPAALMLRLRTAFGVDVRTDTLAYLLGHRGAWADVREISQALLYAKFSVRGACEALAVARLAQTTTQRPVTYRVEQQRWTAFLELKEAPPWRPWAATFAFGMRLRFWLRDSGDGITSPSLAASLAREFMLAHGDSVKQLRIDVPDQRDFLGEAYLPAFQRTVEALCGWLRDNV